MISPNGLKKNPEKSEDVKSIIRLALLLTDEYRKGTILCPSSGPRDPKHLPTVF
jgi:hypothetical protein